MSDSKVTLGSYIPIHELCFGRDAINFWFFVGMHIAAFVGLIFVKWDWSMIVLCIAMYYVRMFGITAGYHRYFSHRSFKTSRIFQFVLAWIGASSLQKGPLWWAAHHRHHHKHADQEEDIHSPTLKGFIWSHTGWFLFSNDYVATKWEYIPDLVKFKELVWINTYHLVPGVVFGLIMLANGLRTFFWGFILSTVLLWHGTFFINSLAHVFGSRRYVTNDTSKNNFLLAILTLGEGWHNNHHTYMSSTNQGFFWYEVDPTYSILKMLSLVGIVSQLRVPPLDKLKEKLITYVGSDPFMEALKSK